MFNNLFKDSKGRIKKLSLIVYLIGIIPLVFISLNNGAKWAQKLSLNKPIKEGYSYVDHIVPNTQAGIIAGLTTFILTLVIWTFLCLVFNKWLKNNSDRVFLNHFFSLGESKVITIIHHLFYVGVFLTIPFAVTFAQVIRSLLRLFLHLPISYNYMGPIFTIISYVIGYMLIIILWKITCELLIVIFRCLEVYYENNKNTQ